ncbi:MULTISPECIES: type II toxin-antitoxin system RnlB family antitoxin [unclassified Clostridium]|uniref:type II toxin-antitoxin system RnlB family antitoxin n=1 Tax=unclassified Clostridium TaxID=2614128 RepID=UPI0025B9E12F|nr:MULTISPECIES: type II toxin-antitoxin system RnlB family antitoxin [unclassified Clostridium]
MICLDLKKYSYKLIDNIDVDYKPFIIELCCEPPTLLLNNIENDLRIKKIKGRILIDCLLYTGNSKDRFIEAYFNGTKFEDDSIKIVEVERGNKFRKITSDFLREEVEILDYSILTTVQKKLILKGLNI